MSGVPIQKQNIGIEERKKTIQYCIDDIKEKENLAIISHVAQEMWQKEKRQYFSVKIVDMKRQSGSDNARCVKNGIHL